MSPSKDKVIVSAKHKPCIFVKPTEELLENPSTNLLQNPKNKLLENPPTKLLENPQTKLPENLQTKLLKNLSKVSVDNVHAKLLKTLYEKMPELIAIGDNDCIPITTDNNNKPIEGCSEDDDEVVIKAEIKHENIAAEEDSPLVIDAGQPPHEEEGPMDLSTKTKSVAVQTEHSLNQLLALRLRQILLEISLEVVASNQRDPLKERVNKSLLTFLESLEQVQQTQQECAVPLSLPIQPTSQQVTDEWFPTQPESIPTNTFITQHNQLQQQQHLITTIAGGTSNLQPQQPAPDRIQVFQDGSLATIVTAGNDSHTHQQAAAHQQAATISRIQQLSPEELTALTNSQHQQLQSGARIQLLHANHHQPDHLSGAVQSAISQPTAGPARIELLSNVISKQQLTNTSSATVNGQPLHTRIQAVEDPGTSQLSSHDQLSQNVSIQVLEHLESSGNEQHQVQHQEPMDLDHLGINLSTDNGIFISNTFRSNQQIRTNIDDETNGLHQLAQAATNLSSNRDSDWQDVGQICTSGNFDSESVASTGSQSESSNSNANSNGGRKSRDEKIIMELGIPYTMDKIINCSMDDFNTILVNGGMDEEQINTCRDIRRRGKNKVAAQNCRKRKVDQINVLSEEVGHAKERKNRILSERESLSNALKSWTGKLARLERFLLDKLNRDARKWELTVLEGSNQIALVPRK